MPRRGRNGFAPRLEAYPPFTADFLARDPEYTGGDAPEYLILGYQRRDGWDTRSVRVEVEDDFALADLSRALGGRAHVGLDPRPRLPDRFFRASSILIDGEGDP